MKKIIVADDEELIRTLICEFLTNEGHEPVQAEDGAEALRLFDENPDTALLILDIMMPHVDGWDVCRQIRKKSSVPIIMLTARNQEFDELMGFEAGVDDYVTKPFSPTVLMKRVQVLLSRKNILSSGDVIEIDNLKLDKAGHTVWLSESPVTLTLKEYNILFLLMQSPEKVFSREQLLDDIWGMDFYGDIRTVDSHVARLRVKLGEWGNKYIRTIYGSGYKIEVNSIAS
ncbi:MAG: response regulator transcription factor [Oscillospiraceae bacterium]|nr:response regulator transcription factor [Oscillospiraceae bacterium]